MAYFANRDNVKPVIRFIPKVMMIFFGKTKAEAAFQSVNWGQFATLDSVIYGITGLETIRIMFPVKTGKLIYFLFAFWGFTVSSSGNTLTNSAIILFTIFRCTILLKFRKCLNFLATRTSFCFNQFRHGFFLVKKLCLEPFTEPISVFGLFYCNSKLHASQGFFLNFM